MKTTCGKEIEGCTYNNEPIICGKTVVKETLQQCPECYQTDLLVSGGAE